MNNNLQESIKAAGFCTRCGQKLTNSKYCIYCGREINTSDQQTQTENQETDQYIKRIKNRYIASLIFFYVTFGLTIAFGFLFLSSIFSGLIFALAFIDGAFTTIGIIFRILLLLLLFLSSYVLYNSIKFSKYVNEGIGISTAIFSFIITSLDIFVLAMLFLH